MIILAAFRTEPELMRAAAGLRNARVGRIETYTPSEPESEEPPVGPHFSPIPLIILLAGVLGATASFLLQTYSTTVSYPLDIGGHPNFSWPVFVPIAFENGALVAVAAGFFAFFIINRLPRLYEPIDESEAFRNASRDGYFLAIREPDLPRARSLLEPFRPELVQELAG
jgi:hypothetical protein